MSNFQLHIPEELEAYLEALAQWGVFGSNPPEVALHLLREGLAAELRGGGLIREIMNKQEPEG